MIAEIFKKIANFHYKHPVLIIGIVVILTVILAYGMTNIKMAETSSKNMLPEGLESVKVMNEISNEFQGTNTLTIAVYIEPSNEPSENEANKNEDNPRDVRNFATLEYIDKISNLIKKEKNVIEVNSVVDLLKQSNNGEIPKDAQRIREILDSNPVYLKQYISDDYEISKIIVKTSSDKKEEKDALLTETKKILDENEKPDGINANVIGMLAISGEISKSMNSDTVKTAGIALIGILLTVCIAFVSVRYGLSTLLPVAFGVIWTFGFMGYINFEMNVASVSGASIMLGLGVDFGIQLTHRFRQEIKNNELEKAMENTLVGVGRPILTTGTAATIGFSVLLLGSLPMLHGLGILLAVGVICCVIVTFLLLPSILILEEKLNLLNIKW